MIKYVLDMKDFGLKIVPKIEENEPWELTCYTDSDYARDPETRRSVSGYVLYVKMYQFVAAQKLSMQLRCHQARLSGLHCIFVI